MHILVINAGSSSLKYQLFDMDTRAVLAKGICERIGIGGHMRHSAGGKVVFDDDLNLPDHSVATKEVIAKLTDGSYGVIPDMSAIDAVGHRIVHGGEHFTDSALVNEQVIELISQCSELAPLHNPGAISGIRACMNVMGAQVPQVVVFDTAFHQTMPPQSYILPIPYEFYEKYKIRRYGFHGTSHRYVSARAAELMGKPIEELKIVVCHLGNGSSVCAVKNGKSFDTSMSFTPLDGLPMGTRSGAIDPAIVGFLSDKLDKPAAEVINMLNKESGLLGISGVSSDYRDLTEADEAGNQRAHITREILFQSIRRYIGAYAAEMGGVDAVAFTAGIGENNDYLRARSVEGLEFMGIVIDPAKNNGCREDRDISADDAKTRTFVIATDEEMMIALDTQRLVI